MSRMHKHNYSLDKVTDPPTSTIYLQTSQIEEWVGKRFQSLWFCDCGSWKSVWHDSDPDEVINPAHPNSEMEK
jgi:hypothetical protein